MSYLIGNQFRRPEQLITSNLGEEFNSARAGGDGVIELPDIKPTRTAGMSRQGGDITRVAPHFYDPRYQHTTLAIPTDERTLHGLYRFFDDHDPLVGNAIRMHTEFPLSDFRLGNCGDPGVQRHYEELWDRIDGDNLLCDITTEFWRIGNVFPFGAWNEEDYMWDQFAIMNPDYVSVQSSWITQKPLITLQPDEYLKRVVNSMQPKMVFDQLPPEIIRYVRLNQEIPMDPNNIFHMAFNKAPYEKLGKSVMKRLLRLLMYEDRLYQAQFAIATRHIIPLTIVKVGDPNLGWVPSAGELEDLREMFAAYELDPNFCYDEETECLTDSGWKHYTDLTYEDKVASFNPDTNALEYHTPDIITVQDYEGDMYHFSGKGYDVKVTPNHRMWVERGGEWQIVHAQDVVPTDIFRAVVDEYEGTPQPTELEIAGETVNSADWFEFIGWYLSEGHLNRFGKDEVQSVCVTQHNEDTSKIVEALFNRLPWEWVHSKDEYKYNINDRKLALYLKQECGVGSAKKSVPRWMMDADKIHLQLLFDAWVAGDGNTWETGDGDTFIVGASVSKQLIDDMQEMAFKLGYGSKKRQRPDVYRTAADGTKIRTRPNGEKYYDTYILHASKGRQMSYPGISRKDKIAVDVEPLDVHPIPRKKAGGIWIDWDQVDLEGLLTQTRGNITAIADAFGCDKGSVCNILNKKNIDYKDFRDGVETVKNGKLYTSHNIQVEPYNGKIWCVSVPTHIIVTRRRSENQYVTISGQTLFYHWGINVEFYGATGKILPVNQEFERIQKLKFIGLGINESLITGQGTYANAYASLQVLRQRYLSLQLKLENLVHDGWFKPVAQAAGFYRSDKRFSSGPAYTGPSYGAVRAFKAAKEELSKSFTSLRDFQDKKQFQEFLRRKALERVTANMESNIEYVYPEMKWGKMSMTQDTAYGNLLAQLKENPLFAHMVSESSVADALHLDREVEMEQTIQEAIEKQDWAEEYQEETGFPPPGGGAGGPEGMGGAPGFGGVPEGEGLGGEGPIAGPGPEMGDLGGLMAVEPGEIAPASPQGEGATEGIASFVRPIVTGVADDHLSIKQENEKLAKASGQTIE